MGQAEFWDSTLKYILMRYKGLVSQKRMEWEQTRFLAFYVLKTIPKNRIKRYQDVCKFDWEQTTPRFVKQTREQLEAFDREADEILRITQPEAYKAYMAGKQAQSEQNGSTAT